MIIQTMNIAKLFIAIHQSHKLLIPPNEQKFKTNLRSKINKKTVGITQQEINRRYILTKKGRSNINKIKKKFYIKYIAFFNFAWNNHPFFQINRINNKRFKQCPIQYTYLQNIKI